MNGGTLLRFLLLLAYVATVPFVFFVLIGTAVWLSDHTHRFGPYDVRYLLLIHGTRVGDLGLVEPIAGTVEYTGQGGRRHGSRLCRSGIQDRSPT